MELELIKLKLAQAEITHAEVTDDALIVDLADGRTISTPILWFPRLANGTCEERSHFEIFCNNIHCWLERRQKAQYTAKQPAPVH